MVAGSASAQGTVNLATRTISATGGSTTPATPGQVASSSAAINGTVDTHLLSQAATQNLIYHISFPTVSAGISGFTDPTGYFQAARASIWLNGHTDDVFILPNGSDNGYGNEFGVAMGGSLFLVNGYTPGTPLNYYFSVSAITSTQGQGNGASAHAFAGATLTGIDAVYNGSVTSSVVFDQAGNGYFTASTPEPSSVAFLATGLLGVVPFARRRRRA